MFSCRDFIRPGAHPLHVHDDPPHLEDIERNLANGWYIHPINTCGAPTLPFQSGDPGVKSPTVIDLTTRG